MWRSGEFQLLNEPTQGYGDYGWGELSILIPTLATISKLFKGKKELSGKVHDRQLFSLFFKEQSVRVPHNCVRNAETESTHPLRGGTEKPCQVLTVAQGTPQPMTITWKAEERARETHTLGATVLTPGRSPASSLVIMTLIYEDFCFQCQTL